MKLATIAIVLLTLGASASTYYVDFEAGSDAAAGTSSGAAWKRCPGDTNATGVAGAATLSAGDVVLFKGGVSYQSKIRLAFSGSQGSPIVYRSGSADGFGSGNAVMDGGNENLDSRRFGFYATNGVANVQLRQFDLTRFGGVTNLSLYTTNTIPDTPGYAVYLVDATNVVVADCLFSELGVWTNGPPASTTISYGGGFGIYAAGVSGLTVTNCEFTKMEKGIRISPGILGTRTLSTGITIQDCNFHNYMRWLIELSVSANGGGISNAVIEGCQFHDFTEYDNGNWLGGGPYPHTDGIMMGVTAYTNRHFSGVIIRRNHFYQTATTGGGTSMIFLSGMGGDVLIHNNLFQNVLHSGGSVYVQDGPNAGDSPLDLKVYNNTFHDNRYAVYLYALSGPAYALTNHTIRIKNNIFYKANSDAAMSVVMQNAASWPDEVDFNIYRTGRGDGLIARTVDPATYKTLAEMRSDWGFESNGITEDPDFTDISGGLGASVLSNDLALLQGSPAIGAGTDLSASFTDDYAGRTRFVPWDIGAYEYGRTAQIGTATVGTLIIGQ